jgi:cell division protein FtsL
MQNKIPVQSFDLVKRTTIPGADATEESGTVTAEEIKHGLYAKKQCRLCCIYGSTIFVSLALIVVSAALQAQVADLQSTIATLQTSNSTLQTQLNTLQSQLNAVLSSRVYALNPYVSVDPNPENGVIGPNITFKGANIHIVSGSGATDDHL